MTEVDQDIIRAVRERIAQEEAALGSGDSDSGKPSSKLIRECLDANVLGDAVLFATQNRDRYVYRKNTGEWLKWGPHHWGCDKMGEVLVAVENTVSDSYLQEYSRISGEVAVLAKDESADGKIDTLKKLQKKLLRRVESLRDERRRNACLTFAHTIEHPLAVAGDEFDQKPMLLACPNGVLDLETGKERPGRPGDYLSMASPIEWKGIDEPAPLWEKSLLEIFAGDEEMVAYIQRLFGYSITGLVHEKVFPVLYGKNGWNGRTLIIESIAHVMGPYARPIPPEMLMSSRIIKSSSGPSPDIMSLKGLRMAFADETDDSHKFSAAQIKRLTGKGELVGRNPHDKRPTYFPQTHKLFLESNSHPQGPPNDKSFWERLQLIEFPISFVNRDPQESHERRAILDLDRQILKEASGILAWLVKGCLLWQRHGLMPPVKVLEAREEYRRGEDILADYIDECLLIEPGAKEKAVNLYQRFATWYESNIGKKVPSGQMFGKWMTRKFEKGKINGVTYYRGVGLRD